MVEQCRTLFAFASIKKNASLSQRGVFFLESKTFRKKHILALKTDAKVLQFCELTKF